MCDSNVQITKEKKKSSRKWKLGLRQKSIGSKKKHPCHQNCDITVVKCRQSIETQINSERHRANVDVMILSILGYITV